MKRAGLAPVVTLALGLLAAPLAAEAQQAGEVPRVGFLLPGAQATSASFVDAFRQGLGGYVEGRTIVIHYRWAEGTSVTSTTAMGATASGHTPG